MPAISQSVWFTIGHEIKTKSYTYVGRCPRGCPRAALAVFIGTFLTKHPDWNQLVIGGPKSVLDFWGSSCVLLWCNLLGKFEVYIEEVSCWTPASCLSQ